MDPRTTTVADIESDLQTALESLRELDSRGRLPQELRPLLLLSPMEGSSVHVSLRHRDKARQIRRGYGAHAFTQRTCGVWIVYEVPHNEWSDEDERGQEPAHAPFEDFVRALHQAESEPQLSFVSLKWFRDTYLVKCGFSWAQDPDVPRRLIQDATEREVVLTSKVPNPKTPAFPVTSIHLNRSHPDVQRILGTDAEPSAGTSAGDDEFAHPFGEGARS
jgi:hypothetical protein